MFEGLEGLVMVVWPVFCFLWSIHFLFVGCFCQFGNECVHQIESRNWICARKQQILRVWTFFLWQFGLRPKWPKWTSQILDHLQLPWRFWHVSPQGLVGLISGIFLLINFFNRKWWSDQQFWGTQITGDSHVTSPLFCQVLMMDTSNHMKAQLTKQHDVGTSISCQAIEWRWNLDASVLQFPTTQFCVLLQSICDMWEVCLFFWCAFCTKDLVEVYSLILSSSGLAWGGSQILRDFERRHRPQSSSGSWWLLLVAAVEEEKISSWAELAWRTSMIACLSRTAMDFYFAKTCDMSVIWM